MASSKPLSLQPGTISRRTVVEAGASLVACADLLSNAYAAQATYRLNMFGDSLVAGYGLKTGEAVPAVLQNALRQAGFDVAVTNGGVSGETSHATRARLGTIQVSNPDGVLIAIGGNDFLQGLSPTLLEKNLDAMVRALQREHIAVAVAGMRALPFYGAAYQQAFDNVFSTVARRYRVPLYPFYLDGVSLNPALNQPDRVHPNAAGARVIAAGLAPFVASAFGLTPR